MDYEVQYDHTIEFVNRILEIIRTYWRYIGFVFLLR